MKDLMSIWSRLAGRHYTSVNANVNRQPSANDLDDSDSDPSNLHSKSAIVVNKFFNRTLSVHSSGRRKWPKSIFTFMSLGLLGITFGVLILVIQPYELLFKLKVIFSDNGEIFELWRKPPVELYLKVYLFNVTNREEYISGIDSKLKFKEIGPYVYREHLEHSNITFNENGTVTAIPKHPLTYIPELSGGAEDDILILPNIALLSIANVMKDASIITTWPLNALIKQSDSHPLVRMTAREFMFGYKSSLVTLGNSFMPSWIKFDKLGLIDRMYDFDGDFETVYTGEKDIRKTGLIEKYNGDVNLPQWTGKCGNVNGASDGAKFPSYIEPNDTLIFYRKSLCRSAKMVRIGEKDVKGLHTYKYKFMDNELDNGANNSENKCFCREGRCLQPGLIDVTDCYYGFPIALSYPHFYESDPSLLEGVEGLKPEKEKHESYFYIQPKSGLPVDLAFRFQINMALQDISRISNVEGFSNLVLPLLWFEIGMYELPESMNNRFILYLNVLPVVQDVATYALFLGGIIFLVWSIVKILLYRPKGPSGRAVQWFESDLQRKRLNFFNEKRNSFRAKPMDTYYNSLLEPKEEMTPMTAMVNSEFKEDLV
ncbi:scavenger receptor class B member 1 isoform X1 [Microplitis demolitor]|uniref:scavenger receptor class B member 1 isoform X1 n=1 Tax=Microplitis demolitor TaxID=69319 RepID=UPI0006D4D926|nr:scavenger receptor class B member 1 isoform X1 [Microplitis demolitor]